MPAAVTDAGKTRKLPSCTECRQRKQKCSREWPCNNCTSRKISHLCRFEVRPSALVQEEPDHVKVPVNTSRKRVAEEEPAAWTTDDDGHTDPSAALRELGYMSVSHLSKDLMAAHAETKAEDAPEAERTDDATRLAIQAMPPRPYADGLVQNFLAHVNYQYYAIYPAQFSSQYKDWWAARTARRRTRPEITSLILRVCAISAQFLKDDGLRKRIESELGETLQSLTDRLHEGAQTLAKTIPPGQGSLPHVQQLFLTASWLKCEESWKGAWHVLSLSIREAQELGMHLDTGAENEFDQEMRRRLWCILYMWDWQCSGLLSRPLIINHSTCKVVLPNEKLEKVAGADPDAPTPFAHVRLQIELIQTLASKFSHIDKNNMSIDDVLGIRSTIEDWMAGFPPVYNAHNTDKKWDKSHDFVCYQRHNLALIGYMSILDPLKPFVTSPPKTSTAREKELRAAGVDYCFRLFRTSWDLYDVMYPVNAKFHFAIFCIFDTATVLCSGILHDQNLPRREEAMQAISVAIAKLSELAKLAKTCEKLCSILKSMTSFLPAYSKRVKPNPEASSSLRTADEESPQSTPTPLTSPSSGASQRPASTYKPESVQPEPVPMSSHFQEVDTSHVGGLVMDAAAFEGLGSHTQINSAYTFNPTIVPWLSVDPVPSEPIQPSYSLDRPPSTVDQTSYGLDHVTMSTASQYHPAPTDHLMPSGVYLQQESQQLGDLGQMWGWPALNLDMQEGATSAGVVDGNNNVQQPGVL